MAEARLRHQENSADTQPGSTLDHFHAAHPIGGVGVPAPSGLLRLLRYAGIPPHMPILINTLAFPNPAGEVCVPAPSGLLQLLQLLPMLAPQLTCQYLSIPLLFPTPQVEYVFQHLQVFSACCVMLAHGAGEVGYLSGPLGAIWHIVNEGERAGAGLVVLSI